MQLPRKMSAQVVIANISRTLGTKYEARSKISNEVKLAGEESKDRLYEPKHQQKAFRVLIVIAYIVCVSLAAIVLSLYYAFIWDPKDHRQFTATYSKIDDTQKIRCSNQTLIRQFTNDAELSGLRNEKLISTASKNSVELLEKSKSNHPQLSIDVKKPEELPNQLNDETFMDSSSIILPLNANEIKMNDTIERNMSQYNLPET